MSINFLLNKKNRIILLWITILFLSQIGLSKNLSMISFLLFTVTSAFMFIHYKKTTHTFFSPAGIFSFIWFFSIGLSQLRLNINQIPFQNETWLILYLTFLCFFVGYESCTISNKGYGKDYDRNKLFYVIIALFIISVSCFILEILFRGFIPLFSNDPNAYVSFSVTGIHYFVVSCILIPPLTVIYLCNQKTSKKVQLLFVIMDTVCFSIPILIVSRQLLLMGIILFFLAITKKFIKYEKILLIGVVILALISFILLSLGRNQNEEYLDYVFNQKNIYTMRHEKDYKLNLNEEKIYQQLYQGINNNYSRIELDNLPMPCYQIYMYIAFNFDNFNYLTVATNTFTYGKKSLFPIFALSGIKFISPSSFDFTVNNYLSTFNTAPICFTPYLDFRIVGVIIYMFIIGVISKIGFLHSENDLGIMNYGIICYSLLFSFFTSFFSNATIIFYFILLFIINSYIMGNRFKRKY